MRLQIDHADVTFVIRSYDPHGVTVNDEVLTSSFIIQPHRLLRHWTAHLFEQLSAADFAPLLEMQPEILLLGTGRRLRFPEPELLAPLHAQGTAVEVMDTGAACRSYAVLAAERRDIAAAILIDRNPPAAS